MPEIEGTTTYDVAKTTSGGWMNEANIVPSSFPYVSAVIGGYTIPRNQLKEVNIEGKTAMSRKGSIKFVDAIGEWPDILMKVGADSNKITNTRKPNISLTFGWKKLRGNYDCLKSLDGLIIRSSIDLTDDGQVMISLEYIETVESVLGSIRYLNPNDIEIIYKKKESGGGGKKLNEMTVGEKLNWLCDWDNGTEVAKQLKDNGIYIFFEDTNDDKDADVNIGFGDYLVDVINELTSKAKKTQEEGINYSFERGICYYNKGTTYIPYRWKAAPDESNSNPQSLFDSMTVGPVLTYKRTAGKGEKQILSFGSDLNSKTSLMMQAQDIINKKLLNFSQEDMDMINDAIREKGMDGLKEKEGTNIFMTDERRSEVDRRNRVKDEMVTVIKSLNAETDTNQNSQLKAILANNVFKGNVKIMGDPTFGTDFEPWKIKMNTNFKSVGGFGALFGARTWTLTYVKHVFGEGSYETELELLTYPEPSSSPISPTAEPAEYIGGEGRTTL